MEYKDSSRYFKCDTENDIPQLNLTRFNCTTYSTIVKPEEKSRLDLVAYRVYGNPSFWWKIAIYNSIIDPNLIYPGMSLEIPDL